MTSIKDEIVPKFRRAIGDNETPYSYADTILAEYIADSLESIQICLLYTSPSPRD